MTKSKKKKKKSKGGPPPPPPEAAATTTIPALRCNKKKMAKSKKKKKKSKGGPPPPPPEAAATTTIPVLPRKKKKKKKSKGPSPQVALLPCTHGAQSGGEGMAGFIFLCDSKTKPDCFRFHVFGVQKKLGRSVEMIGTGTTLFLFDVDMKLLYGVYQATSSGGMTLEPQAFSGRFPAQVRFKIEKDCLPIHETDFKNAIKDNYKSEHKFRPQLNSQQVNKLSLLCCTVDSLQQPPHFQTEEQSLPSCYYHHLEDPIRSEPIACASTHVDPHYKPEVVPPANVLHGSVEHYMHAPPVTGHQYLEGTFRSRLMVCASTHANLAPTMIPPVNLPHGPAENYMHASAVNGHQFVPLSAPLPPYDPRYCGQQTGIYNRMEPAQRSYLEYERPMPQMIAKDQYTVPSDCQWMPGYEAARRPDMDIGRSTAFTVANAPNMPGQPPYV